MVILCYSAAPDAGTADAAVAALTQCIISMLYRLRCNNQRWRVYPRILVNENRWRAQRYGVGDSLVDFGKGELVPYPALLVLGPFMQQELQADFMARARKLERVEAIIFDPNMESLEDNAGGMVSMGGYNTFCEILSLDKRAIIVPRTEPRLEQFIRASRGEELGLVRMLVDDGSYDAQAMATALRALPRQRRPSEVIVPGLLEGLVNVNRLIEPWIKPRLERAADAVIPRRA